MFLLVMGFEHPWLSQLHKNLTSRQMMTFETCLYQTGPTTNLLSEVRHFVRSREGMTCGSLGLIFAWVSLMSCAPLARFIFRGGCKHSKQKTSA